MKDRVLTAVTVLLTLGALLSAANYVYQRRGAPSWRQSMTSTVDRWESYGQAGHVLGDRIQKPVVTIVEFGDYQCAFCRRLEMVLDTVRAHHPEQILVLYRHFPLSAVSADAAAAAICAERQGHFSAMHSLLMKDQSYIGQRSWIEFATQAGVPDTTAFENCLSAPDTRASIARDSSAANQLGASGTPAMLVNNIFVDGWVEAPRLDSLIAEVQ